MNSKKRIMKRELIKTLPYDKVDFRWISDHYDVHLNGSCEHEWMNSRLTLQGKSLKVCLKCRRTEQTVC